MSWHAIRLVSLCALRNDVVYVKFYKMRSTHSMRDTAGTMFNLCVGFAGWKGVRGGLVGLLYDVCVYYFWILFMW